jgi:hypothetical protein
MSTIINLKVIGPCSGTFYPVPTTNQNFSVAWLLWEISGVSKLPMLLSTKAGIAKDTV